MDESHIAERARLQREIDDAERSLAAAESRLTFDGKVLTMALELVEDVAKVYEDSSALVRRAWNQAFFSKLKVKPRRERESGMPIAADVAAEVSPPYELVLAPTFIEQVEAEIAKVERGLAPGKESGPSVGAATSVSMLEVMAGWEGKRSN